ncbi:MAG: LysR family transcriptional regulator, low CO2-responsive transcriptional regulator [Solirubrobacteraceae bacterium]|nr:LysR family transcriptional regulator, low CO2-responsive transcriptional regulator [Solirubrobacteraceae bacterium]
MTLSQLRSFLTVARLGSVKAAARALSVSEPAVSGAVGALRRELGDDLYVRSGGAIELTPGGRRLATAAAEILLLADDARVAVRESRGPESTLRVAVTPSFAELAAEQLLDAFRRRHPGIDVVLRIVPAHEFAALLADGHVEAALGPRVRREETPVIESEPFLRYTMVVVAAPGHALAGSHAVAPAALVGTPWLLGPSGTDPATETGAFLARQAIAPQRSRTFPNIAAALAQVAAGRGVSLTVAHAVRDELERGALVTLDVRGTPISSLWHVSVPGPDRLTGPADALRRFVARPEATRAMLARAGGVPDERSRPAIQTRRER